MLLSCWADSHKSAFTNTTLLKMGVMWSICGSGSDVDTREDRYKVDANGNNEPPKAYSWDRRGEQDPKNFLFDGIESETVGKMPGQIQGQQFIIQNCNNANIYLFDNTASVNIDDCTNCCIFVGPCKGSVFVRDCKQCKLMIACQQFRTRDCQDLDVFLFCSTQPIIEESKQIRFACLQIFYEQLSAQLDCAALCVFNNCWSKIHDFTPSQGNCSCLPEDADPLHYISFTSTEGFSLPPVSIEREHSLIPLTLGVRPAPSREVTFVLCFCDGEGKKPLRNRCLELIRIVQNRVRFVQSKEVEASADDLERILGTPERKQLAGFVIGMELCGSDAATVVKEAVAQQGWIHIAYIAEAAVTKQQLAKFYSFADMKLGV